MIEFSPLPELFIKEPKVETIEIDKITYAKYKNHTNISMYKANVTVHMFIILLEGKKFIFNSKETLTVSKGEAFFIPKGSHLLSEIVSDLNSFESLVFFIDDEYLNNFIKKHVKSNITLFKDEAIYKPEVFKINIDTCHSESLKSILPYFLNNSEYKKELFKLKLEEMLLIMSSTNEGRNYFSYLLDLKESDSTEMATYMELNYTKPYTIDQFAQNLGKSLSSFKREFKDVYDFTPKKWINERRLNYSCTLLKNTDINITDICYKVGYTNLPYFIKLFKDKFGTTPKKYQLNQKQQKLN